MSLWDLMTSIIIISVSCSNLSTYPASANTVITSDEGLRGGKTIPLKAIVDDAVRNVEGMKRVFVSKRTGAEVNMQSGRDIWLEEVFEKAASCSSGHHMYIVVTLGTQPVGCYTEVACLYNGTCI